MGVIVYPRSSEKALKPALGERINWSHPLASGLSYVVVPMASFSDADIISQESLSVPATWSAPSLASSSRFGAGWFNNATNQKGMQVANAAGWVKGQSKFSAVALCRPIALPSSASHVYAQDCVADASGTTRFGMILANNANGATGTKWDYSFRSGLAASTRRDVNAGAGGTTVFAGLDYVVGASFDQPNSDFRLYVNGVLEATLSVSESAIANTNPAANPRFTAQTDGFGPANGILCGFFFWKGRVLSAAEMALLNENPWAVLSRPRRRTYVSISGTTFTLNISDGLTMSDSRTNGAAISKSETIAMSDVRTNAASVNKADSITMGDAQALAASKVLVESGLTISDLSVASAAKALSDSFGLSDSAALSLAAILIDSIIVTDTKSVSVGKMVSDSFGLVDSVNSVRGKSLDLSDDFAIGDDYSASLEVSGRVLKGGGATFGQRGSNAAHFQTRTKRATFTISASKKAKY